MLYSATTATLELWSLIRTALWCYVSQPDLEIEATRIRLKKCSKRPRVCTLWYYGNEIECSRVIAIVRMNEEPNLGASFSNLGISLAQDGRVGIVSNGNFKRLLDR
jgi:hypothetical protein